MPPIGPFEPREPSHSHESLGGTTLRTGLYPLFAFTAVGVDSMTCALEIASVGTLFFVSLMCAVVLFFIGVLMQRYGAKQEWGLAIATAGAVSLLTAIPSALPSFVTAAWGLSSYFANRRRAPSNDNVIDVDVQN